MIIKALECMQDIYLFMFVLEGRLQKRAMAAINNPVLDTAKCRFRWKRSEEPGTMTKTRKSQPWRTNEGKINRQHLSKKERGFKTTSPDQIEIHVKIFYSILVEL